MRYIRKIETDFEIRGVSQTQNFIDGCWQNDSGKYVNLKYDRSRLNGLQSILFEEQKDSEGFSHCCYCMRKLYLQDTDGHKANVTLEHIIPNKITEDKWENEKKDYLKFDNLKSDHIVVCFDGELSEAQRTKQGFTSQPHPHSVSYHNLVASCDGRTVELGQCVDHNYCNNKRGDKFILPFYLDSSMANDIVYDKNGNLNYTDTSFQDDWFTSLNLNCSWLKLIRKIWYCISQSSYSIQDIENARNDCKIRQDIIDDIDTDNEIASWQNNNVCWNLLSEYSWFYQYYKNKYSKTTS